jgi:hypothetical protein
MADLDAIIQNSMNDAGIGEASSADTEVSEDLAGSESPETTDTEEVSAPEGEEAAPDLTAKAPEGTPEDAKDAPVEPVVDPYDKELEALGLKPPVEGERENRLPYSRTKKIVTNAIKRTEAKFTSQVQERDAKVATAEKELDIYHRTDRLIEDDPDRFIGMLAAMHPDKYKKFVEGVKASIAAPVQPAKTTEAAIAALGPRPAPDAQYPDGSKGYSAEQHEKLLDWVAQTAEAKAVARTEAQLAERLGPFEKERQAQQAIQEQVPRIKAQADAARKRWGPLYEAEEKLDLKSPLLAYMKANPSIPFDAACADFFLPKIQADRNTMRADLLKEINARPKAAIKGVPSTTSGAKASVSDEPQSLDDVIKEAMAAAGLK